MRKHTMNVSLTPELEEMVHSYVQTARISRSCRANAPTINKTGGAKAPPICRLKSALPLHYGARLSFTSSTKVAWSSGNCGTTVAILKS